jgi:hypothetical protein
VQRGRGRGREEGKAWAYSEGWPWTTSIIARAYHVLPMYDLRAANKRREGCKGEEEGEGRRGKHGRIVRGGHALLQVSLGPTMSYPCTTCVQPTREGKGAKGKRKGKGGGEGMGVWQGLAMDYFKYR